MKYFIFLLSCLSLNAATLNLTNDIVLVGEPTTSNNPVSLRYFLSNTSEGDTSWRDRTNDWNLATNEYATLAQGALADTAWQNPASAVHWGWSKTATEVTLTNYDFYSMDITIPDTLDGLPVTGFGTIFSQSMYCFDITAIRGGKNVTSLDGNAFGNGELLTTIDLPSLKTIGVTAFANCSSLASISLPSITSISDGAFYGAASLKSVIYGGNAPAEGVDIYYGAGNVTNYVTNPTTTGWGATFGNRPVVRLPVYGSGSSLTDITAAQVGAVASNDARYLASLTNVITAGGITNITVNGTAATVAGGVASVTISAGGGGDVAAASNNVFTSATPITFSTSNAVQSWLFGGLTNSHWLTPTSDVTRINGTNYVFQP